MVRPNELSFARRGALSKLADRARGARPGHLVGRLVGLDSEDDHRAVVAFGDTEVSVLSGPHKLVPGALVAVEVDSTNAPTRITGPVTTRPEGLDEDVPAPDAVVPMPELGPRELTEAEAQAIQDTAGGLAETQGRVSAAEGLLDAIGASDGPDGVADAISDYLAIPLDQITIVDNRGADGNVVANLYDAIIVDGLLTASGVITEDLIATGAIESRHLNVVPEEGTGGVEILPPGIRIIPPDAEAGTAVSLRTDEENWLSFAKNGESTFSVNSDGRLSAQEISANDSLVYQGVEVSDLLNALPRGVIAMAHNGGSGNTFVGTGESRLLSVSFDPPQGNRAIRITYEGRIAPGAARETYFILRHSTDDTAGTPTPNNTLRWDWEYKTLGVEDVVLSRTSTTQELGWTTNKTVYLGLFVQSQNSSIITFYQDQRIIVEDLGPAVNIQSHRPWVPSTGGGTGGGSGTEQTERDYTYRQKSSWVRSFLGNNNFYNYGAGRAYQGLQPSTSNGNLKSMIGWPSLTSTLNGATIKSIKVRIKNNHSYSSAGVTAHIGLHSRTSAPSSWAHSVGDVVTSHFTRGQTKTLTIPSSYHAGFKNGNYTGITLYSSTSSLSKYGYWDGTNAELIIEYRK